MLDPISVEIIFFFSVFQCLALFLWLSVFCLSSVVLVHHCCSALPYRKNWSDEVNRGLVSKWFNLVSDDTHQLKLLRSGAGLWEKGRDHTEVSVKLCKSSVVMVVTVLHFLICSCWCQYRKRCRLTHTPLDWKHKNFQTWPYFPCFCGKIWKSVVSILHRDTKTWGSRLKNTKVIL